MLCDSHENNPWINQPTSPRRRCRTSPITLHSSQTTNSHHQTPASCGIYRYIYIYIYKRYPDGRENQNFNPLIIFHTHRQTDRQPAANLRQPTKILTASPRANTRTPPPSRPPRPLFGAGSPSAIGRYFICAAAIRPSSLYVSSLRLPRAGGGAPMGSAGRIIKIKKGTPRHANRQQQTGTTTQNRSSVQQQ